MLDLGHLFPASSLPWMLGAAVLVAGRKIADGDPQSVVGNAEVVRAYLGE